ncbi:MAG: isochorismatase family protein [Bacteroidales bacterium]|nr:isochorismatase family protein [Bacteroidales bacterium]
MISYRNALLLIDMQYDFCHPKGALYVPGADKDVVRTAGFIRNNRTFIERIIFTMDFHQVTDISHPRFWANREGRHPVPFTRISSQDIEEGKWRALFYPETAHAYVRNLELQGEYVHTIWPEHCIMGSRGSAIADEVMDAVREWAEDGRFFRAIIKGTNPLTEHFGAIRANIPVEDDDTTKVNNTLLKELEMYDTIYLAGEARSHCVANTIKQLGEFPHLIKKLVLLEDCTSSVPGFEDIASTIYEKAFASGMRVCDSETRIPD